MANWLSHLSPEIRAKFAAQRQGSNADRLTIEECRFVVRAPRIMILLEPKGATELAIHLKRFAGLARMKKKHAREAAARMSNDTLARIEVKIVASERRDGSSVGYGLLLAALFQDNRSHDRLASLVNMHVLDPHQLGAAASQTPQRLDLHGECFDQTGRSVGARSHRTLASVIATEPSEDAHRGGVGAGHLNHQRALDLIPGQCSFDEGKGSVYRYL